MNANAEHKEITEIREKLPEIEKTDNCNLLRCVKFGVCQHFISPHLILG